MKTTIISKVVDGKLTRNRKLITQTISSLEGKDIEITIQKKRKRRSSPQNQFYWACVVPLIKSAIHNTWGEIWTKEKTHEFLKSTFLFEEKVNEETGQIIRVPKSTTENTTVEQEEYYSQIREFAKEWFGIEIPLPNEDLILG